MWALRRVANIVLNAALAKPLTAKQQRFVDAYSGNATEAARLAGYAGSAEVLGQVGAENLKKPQIAAAIAKRESKVTKKLIATREQRQEFWSRVMLGPTDGEPKTLDDLCEMKDRLKASELLGKSEADFTEKLDHSGNLTVSIAINGIKRGGG